MGIKALAAAACVAILPMTVGAVTVTESINLGLGSFNNPFAINFEGPVTEYVATYTNTEGKPIAISAFNLTFQGTSATQVSNMGWSLSGAPFTPFVPSPSGTGFTSMVSIPDFDLPSGGSFSIAFLELATPTGSGSYSFEATPIPLPAAGWLLISGLGGVALLGRRRNKMA